MLYTLILFGSVLVVYLIRKGESIDPISLAGSTMGTTYHVTYFDREQRNFKGSIDSILNVFNLSLNTYLEDAEISRFNRGRSLRFELPFFLPVLQRSSEIARESDGTFDPTVMPLVNAWGFGPGKSFQPDSIQIDSILDFVGMDKIQFNTDSLWKLEPRAQLDFSAIAKGYGVDVVAAFLMSKGITDLFAEIGGEVIAFGTNVGERRPWRVGILDPNSTYDNQEFLVFAELRDRAIATSGNYFNYRQVNGKKYSHTINPETGYPVQREILSASVFAKDCMTADAWATAFMVMGHDKALELVERHKDIDAFLIYTGENGEIKTVGTPGIRDNITYATP